MEISRGLWHIGDTPIDLIDLPGAYSLDPLSPDEAFTREMLVDCPADERPDVVVVLIDATAPARGLNLAFQVAEHPYRVVLAVTKQDVAADQGIHIDLESLAKAVGMPVVAVNGRRRENLGGLRDAVTRALATEPAVVRPDTDLERRFADLDAAEKAAVQRAEVGPSISERIDRVALHPVLGPVLFLAVMWAVFMITTKVAAPL